jgi:hypothetical protein
MLASSKLEISDYRKKMSTQPLSPHILDVITEAVFFSFVILVNVHISAACRILPSCSKVQAAN